MLSLRKANVLCIHFLIRHLLVCVLKYRVSKTTLYNPIKWSIHSTQGEILTMIISGWCSVGKVMIQAIDLTQKQTQFLYLIVSQSTALRRIREVYVFGAIDQITMKVQRKCGKKVWKPAYICRTQHLLVLSKGRFRWRPSHRKPQVMWIIVFMAVASGKTFTPVPFAII